MKAIFYVMIILFPTTMFPQAWQWSKQIGGPGMDHALIGHVDPQGNVYIYGNYAQPYQLTNYNNCYVDNDTLFGSSEIGRAHV